MRSHLKLCATLWMAFLPFALPSCQSLPTKDGGTQVDFLQTVSCAGSSALPGGAKPKLVVLYEAEGEAPKWGSLWDYRKRNFVLSEKNKRLDVAEIDKSRADEILGIAAILRSENSSKEPQIDPKSKFAEITVYSFLSSGVKIDRVSQHAKLRDELLAHGRGNEIDAGQIANALLGGGWLESRDLYVE